MSTHRRAIVLLSGGLDSSTALAIAKKEGFSVFGLTFNYGQRHNAELEAAKRVAAKFQIERHMIIPLDLRMFGGSSLTDSIPVPKDRNLINDTGIPVTYVPARNTIFLSFAMAWAEVTGVNDIFIGVNALDYSGYPDCRPEYIEAFARMANLATKAATQDGRALTIHTPLINLTKAEIIARGRELQVDYSLTSTCYDPSSTGVACGTCDACLLRLKGFSELGISDPIAYQSLAQVVS